MAALLAGRDLCRGVGHHPGGLVCPRGEDALQIHRFGDEGGVQVDDEAAVTGGGHHGAGREGI